MCVEIISNILDRHKINVGGNGWVDLGFTNQQSKLILSKKTTCRSAPYTYMCILVNFLFGREVRGKG